MKKWNKSKYYMLLKKAGWTTKQGKHIKMTCSCGENHVVILSKTPGRKSYEMEKKCDIRKTNCPSIKGVV